MGVRPRCLVAAMAILCHFSAAGLAEEGQSQWMKCWKGLRALAQWRVVPSEIPKKAVTHTAKAIFYPVAALAQATRYLLQRSTPQNPKPPIGRAVLAGVKKDLWHLAAYLALLLSSQATSITFSAMDTAVEWQEQEESRVVVVNGFLSGSNLHTRIQQRFETRYGHLRNAVSVEPGSWTAMMASLREYARTIGPIDYLEIHGHGYPGIMAIQTQPVSGPGLAAERAIASKRNPGPAESFFAPNAVIVVYACGAAYGPEGERFLSEIAQLLRPNGGTVYGATVVIHTNLLNTLGLDPGMSAHPLWQLGHGVTDTAFAPLHLAKHLYPDDEGRLSVQFDWPRVRKTIVPAERAATSFGLE